MRLGSRQVSKATIHIHKHIKQQRFPSHSKRYLVCFPNGMASATLAKLCEHTGLSNARVGGQTPDPPPQPHISGKVFSNICCPALSGFGFNMLKQDSKHVVKHVTCDKRLAQWIILLDRKVYSCMSSIWLYSSTLHSPTRTCVCGSFLSKMGGGGFKPQSCLHTPKYFCQKKMGGGASIQPFPKQKKEAQSRPMFALERSRALIRLGIHQCLWQLAEPDFLRPLRKVTATCGGWWKSKSDSHQGQKKERKWEAIWHLRGEIDYSMGSYGIRNGFRPS